MDRFSSPGSAYRFDGSGTYIKVPNSPLLVFADTSDFSVSSWVKFNTSQSVYAGIIAQGPSSTFYPGYQLVIRGSGKFQALVTTADQNFAEITSIGSYQDGQWHHVVFSVSVRSKRLRLYVDGEFVVQVNVQNLKPWLNNDAPFFIGKERNSSKFFNGSIDDVRVINKELSLNEVATLYHENGW
jgi:hypothetical protein